jgi:hypothetical protein
MMMRHPVYQTGLALAVLLGGGLAQAQTVSCQTAQFSDAVVQRFPNVRSVCLNIIVKDGQQYATVTGHFLRASGNTVYVRFKMPDGSYSDTRAIKTKPEFRTMVNGSPTRVSDLATDQELSVYVKVTEPQIAMVPAAPTEPLYLEPIPPSMPAPAPAAAPVMPKTASQLPALGMLGVALLGFAATLTILRTRRRRRQEG